MSLTLNARPSLVNRRAAVALEYISLLERDSTIVGFDAGRLNSTGVRNTIYGYEAADGAASGDLNVAVGYHTSRKSAGSRNTTVGTSAFASNVSGYDNVSLGYQAAGLSAAGEENVFTGAFAGLRVGGTGNVGVGFRSCATDDDALGLPPDLSSGNVAVGWYTEARGGAALALGAGARAEGVATVAVGHGALTTGANSVGIGANVTVAGGDSLVIKPRPDGLPSAHSKDEELNVFGVLTGERETGTGVYRVGLASDSVRVQGGGNFVLLDGNTATIYARSNVLVSAPLVAAGGFRATGGPSRFDGEAAFNDPARFNAAVAVAAPLETRDVTVLGGVDVSGDVRIRGALLVDGEESGTRDIDARTLRVREAAHFDSLLSACNLQTLHLLAGDVTAASLAAASLAADLAVLDRLEVGGGGLSLAGGLRVGGDRLEAAAGLSVAGGALLRGETRVAEGQLVLEREPLLLAGLSVAGGEARLYGGLRVAQPACSCSSASSASSASNCCAGSNCPGSNCPCGGSNGPPCYCAAADFEVPAHFHRGAFVHGPLTVAGAAAFDDVTVDRLRVLDDFDFPGILTSSGLARIDLLEVPGSADILRLWTTYATVDSNLAVLGDAAFSGAVSMTGALVSGGGINCQSLQCDDIVCNTILVKGTQTLRVLGNSFLNYTEANLAKVVELRVSQTADFEFVVVNRDLWVEGTANVGDLVVRHGMRVEGPALTVAGRLEVDGPSVLAGPVLTADLSASNLTAADLAATRLRAGDAFADSLGGYLVYGRDAAFSNLSIPPGGSLQVRGGAALGDLSVSGDLAVGGDLSASNLSASNLAAADIAATRLRAGDAFADSLGGYLVYGRDAAFSNLSIPPGGSLQVRGGAALGDLSVSGNLAVGGDINVSGTIYGNIDIDLGFSIGDNFLFRNDVLILGGLGAIGNVSFSSNLSVDGRIRGETGLFTDGLRLEAGAALDTDDSIVLWNRLDPARLSHWSIHLGWPDSNLAPGFADLLFSSWRGTHFSVCEDASEMGVLSFTGSHRCCPVPALAEAIAGAPADVLAAGASPDPAPTAVPVGSIVVATGRYRDLAGRDRPSVSESLPVVDLSRRPRDPAVFGVVAAVEAGEDERTDNPTRVFQLANLRFHKPVPPGDGRRLVVNSSGEGGILTCGDNGPIKLGDLIVTSSRPGVGMRQGDDVVRACSVAKALNDCDFEGGAVELVGCLYLL